MPHVNKVSSQICSAVHKNGTPFKKPKNKGGSPKGVSEPPILATKNIKNTTTCTLCLRLSFALSSGRIISIAAPVVPIKLANNVPIANSKVFNFGLPCKLPLIKIPPEIMNKLLINMTKGRYSAIRVWASVWLIELSPSQISAGTINSSVQKIAILP